MDVIEAKRKEGRNRCRLSDIFSLEIFRNLNFRRLIRRLSLRIPIAEVVNRDS